jgi:hypothetical protein
MADGPPRPQPDEDWRTYLPTPFGPGAITRVVLVIEVTQHPHLGEVVRYRQLYPQQSEEVEEMLLDTFVRGYVAPHEDEDAWWRRYRETARRAAADSQPDPRSSS